MTARRDPFTILVAITPLAFVLHVLEEAPGFVDWANAHVSRGITEEMFWQGNLFALFITVIVAAIVWFERSEVSALVGITWLSFLMGGNAILHIGAMVVDGRYVPGLITAIVLYVPLYCAALVQARRRGVTVMALATTSILGALPMVIHGLRILFLGRGLF